MNNETVREYAKISGVKLWQIAEALGMRDSNFSKLLRHQLSAEKEAEICALIDQLSANSRKETDNNG